PATAGNGVAEPPFEICDAPTLPQSCAVSCPPDTACTAYRPAGAAGSCDLRCVIAAQVTACRNGDGCCPPGCSADGDPDCAPVCGNGVLEDGERCDKGITTGQPGAC